MSNIKRFEALICWQKSRELVRIIYSFTENEKFRYDYSLKDQIRRAAISIMLNIAEGFGRRSHKEFKQYLFISHGSASELQSSLYILLDLEYISKDKFEELYLKCEEISKIISGLIKRL
jgi:four helix bundle protein